MLIDEIPSNPLRIIVVSTLLVFGIILPQYVHFSLVLAGYNFTYKAVALSMCAFAVALAAFFSYAPFKKTASAVLLTMSLLVAALHLLFDITLKEIAAEVSGIYSEEKTNMEQVSGRIEHDLQWLKVKLPGNWKRKTHQSTGLTYFENDRNQAIRVTCAPPTQKLSNIIFNELNLLPESTEHPTYSCSKTDKTKSCTLNAKTSHYYLSHKDFPEIAVLELVGGDGKSNSSEGFHTITSSVKINPESKVHPTCITPAEWL